ncbi:protein of unknown function [Methylococcus capsulatus]|uniref:Uncharacterized protein n=1 Tax=Methylococcus capsulatus TaxID=414 RepID=A0AA35UJH7_METCP|nr:protein of unknown function [Methylococcus capsulatus]
MSPVTRQRQIRPSPGSRRALAEAGTDLPQRPDGLDLFFHLAQDVGDADSQAFWARVSMKETSAPGFHARRSPSAGWRGGSWPVSRNAAPSFSPSNPAGVSCSTGR